MHLIEALRTYGDYITVTAAILTLASMVLAFISYHESSESSKTLKNLIEGFADSYLDGVTREIVRNLKGNTKLAKRMTDGERSEKEALGELLSSEGGLIPALMEEYSSFFIESGSTLAYLGKWLHEKNCFEKIKFANVTTNNILINHLLVFNKNVQIHMLPGTPIGQYGATFGGGPCEEPIDLVNKLHKWRDKTGHPRPTNSPSDLMKLGQFEQCTYDELYLGTSQHMEAMYKEICKFFDSEVHTPKFLIMTTSKISIEDGPHVGSSQNNDFKRNMFRYANENGRRIPFFMVVHDGKIHKGKIKHDKCLPLFDDGTAGMAKAIGNGELILVVTKSICPSAAISSDSSDGSNAIYLFKEMVELNQRLPTKQKIKVYESSDRRVRIFIGENSKCHNIIHEMGWPSVPLSINSKAKKEKKLNKTGTA